jgi:hypothetical protein
MTGLSFSTPTKALQSVLSPSTPKAESTIIWDGSYAATIRICITIPTDLLLLELVIARIESGGFS